jgi:hypothetical protein
VAREATIGDNDIDWKAVRAFEEDCRRRRRNYGTLTLTVARSGKGLTSSERIERPFRSDDDYCGGMYGTGGFYGCAKHVDELIESFRHSCEHADAECGVFWSPSAKMLYEEMREKGLYEPCFTFTPEEALARLREDHYLFRVDGHRHQLFDDLLFALRKKYTEQEIEAMLSEIRTSAWQRLREEWFKGLIWEMGATFDYVGRKDFKRWIESSKKKREAYLKYCELTGAKPREFFWIEEFEKINASLVFGWDKLWEEERKEIRERLLEVAERQLASLGLTEDCDLFCGLYGYYFDAKEGKLKK